MKESKEDLVILDQCLDGITGLEQINLFKNSKIIRLIDIDLKENSSDSEILEKAKLIARSGEYLSVTILTADKGGDNDKTFTDPQKDVSIICCSYINIVEKFKNSGLKSLSQWKDHRVEVYEHEVRKTKVPKYGKSQQTKIENITNKKIYESNYTKIN